MVRSCDERRPECSQCRRVRKPCPGVYGGLFMVNAAALPDHAPLQRIPVEPSCQPLYEQALVSTFIASFSISDSHSVQPDSWTQYLSTWASSPKALGWSIRATTLAFYAQVSQETAIYQEASRCYAHALRGQSVSVNQCLEGFGGQITVPSKVPTEEDIYASLMLMYYELISPASIGSWITHLRGTAQLLLLRGPQNCQTGAIHLVFRSVRLLLAQASITIQEQSCFASPTWCDMPFALSKKTALDILLDAMHEVIELLRLGQIERCGDKERLHPLISRLESLAQTVTKSESVYLHEFHASYSTQTIASNCLAFQLIEVERLDDGMWLGGGDFRSAIPAVMFHTIRILMDHLRRQTTDEDYFAEESTTRCSVLLQFAHGLFQRDLLGKLNEGSCMQLVFPLEVVRRYSLCETQKVQARIYLDRLGWKEEP
ncbi:Zn(II)2Cys6 transcription factor [Aspergillus affinis]|uniref:Zn(II)2Cys6 transcription factor n=1 Tax=Aspergillus affinis TaxID=1070780 RepID=UPI0022FE0FB7|nr:uncharacterized protein KD926_010772 [Aspergillus affinis]KAI9038460.1 hypothetical protein KD926_010772 [Aspergillus affinis]